MNEPARALTKAPAPRNDYLATAGCILSVLGWGTLLGLFWLLCWGVYVEVAPGVLLVLTALNLILTGTSWMEKHGRSC